MEITALFGATWPYGQARLKRAKVRKILTLEETSANQERGRTAASAATSQNSELCTPKEAQMVEAGNIHHSQNFTSSVSGLDGTVSQAVQAPNERSLAPESEVCLIPTTLKLRWQWPNSPLKRRETNLTDSDVSSHAATGTASSATHAGNTPGETVLETTVSGTNTEGISHTPAEQHERLISRMNASENKPTEAATENTPRTVDASSNAVAPGERRGPVASLAHAVSV